MLNSSATVGSSLIHQSWLQLLSIQCRPVASSKLIEQEESITNSWSSRYPRSEQSTCSRALLRSVTPSPLPF